MAKIELIQASPRVTPAGDIELDLKAALLKERFAEHGDEGIQVPNISFQVSLAQANTTPLPPRGIPEDGEVKHNAVATQPARRKLPDDICGHMRIEADRTLNRPTIVNDFRVVLNTVGATQPKSVCAFIAALINEMLALFDRSEIYAHPNRRRQFLAIAREALNQSTPEYSGLLSILSELEKSLDRRAEIGKVRTVTGWEPAPGSFDFDPTAITSRFDRELSQLVSDQPRASEVLCGPEGMFDLSMFPPDERRNLNISFQSRSDLTHATGTSGENGVFEASGLKININEFQLRPEVTLEIKAIHPELDDVKEIIGIFRINISEQLKAASAIREELIEAEKTQQRQEADLLAQKEAEAARMALKQAQYEALDPERKRQIKEMITRAGEDIKSRTRLQVDPFNTLREYADHPHAIRTAHMVAEEAPDRTIAAVAIYKSAPWAFEVMQIATGKEPQGAIDMVGDFKDMEWAPEVLKVAAQRFPHQVINAMPQYCEYPWNKDVVMHIAEIHPQAVFETALMWEFYPWAEEAAMCAANKAPEFAMNNLKLYQDQPWAERVYKMVAVKPNVDDVDNAEQQRLLKKKITDTGAQIAGQKLVNEGFAFLYEQRLHSQTKVVMTNLADKASDLCLTAASIYKSAEWAKEVVLAAATKSPLTGLNCLDQFIEMSWAEQVMMIIATKQPVACIHDFQRFGKLPWAKGVLLHIATKFPNLIFDEIDYIEYLPWAEDLTSIAASQNPHKALANISSYKGQPWALRIIKSAEDKIIESERIERKRIAAQKRAEDRQRDENKIAAQLSLIEADVSRGNQHRSEIEAEKERIAAEKRIESERVEKERIAVEKRIESERVERERIAAEKRIESERVERERIAAEKRIESERRKHEESIRATRKRFAIILFAAAGLAGGGLYIISTSNDPTKVVTSTPEVDQPSPRAMGLGSNKSAAVDLVPNASQQPFELNNKEVIFDAIRKNIESLSEKFRVESVQDDHITLSYQSSSPPFTRIEYKVYLTSDHEAQIESSADKRHLNIKSAKDIKIHKEELKAIVDTIIQKSYGHPTITK